MTDIETITLLNELLTDTLKLREKAETLMTKNADYFGNSDFSGIYTSAEELLSRVLKGIERANQCITVTDYPK